MDYLSQTAMSIRKSQGNHPHYRCAVEHLRLPSYHLAREVLFDLYYPPSAVPGTTASLLLINDGQDLPKMHFRAILDQYYLREDCRPVLCVGIHAGHQRKQEYGTAGIPDYMGRGSKAGEYTRFVMSELMPFLRRHTKYPQFLDKSFAGFSLGGLMALDIVWKHPEEFLTVGIFSGALWWRKKALDDDYDDDRDRIMHQLIRQGKYAPWLRFFFQTGLLDEKADRNNNGIIDSVEDTLDLIDELKKKGYHLKDSIHYLEMTDGTHDVQTWAKAFPDFLRWAYSN